MGKKGFGYDPIFIPHKSKLTFGQISISKKIVGKKGFGYDPIFIPNNYKKTYGQMNRNTKAKIDHRSVAFKKLKKKLKFNKFFI